MTDQAFQTLVEKISTVFFQKLLLHRATFNRRLKATGGRYHLASHHLNFSPAVFLKYGQEELEKIIEYELCHCHLYLTGKGYQHKDKDLKELLARTGGARYAPSLVERKKVVFHQYQCQSCGEVIPRKRRTDMTQYVCGKCHGRLS